MNKREIIYTRVVLVITFTIGLACGFIAGYYTNEDKNKDIDIGYTTLNDTSLLNNTCFQTSPCGSRFVAIQYCIKNISREDFMKDKFVQDYLIYECGDKNGK